MSGKKYSVAVIAAVFLFLGLSLPPAIMPRGVGHVSPIGLSTAQAAARTKTIVYFVGSVVSTTAIASAATTTFNFTVAIPDIVPATQPIRSAYIQFTSWMNNTSAMTASSFTLNKQGGAAQALANVKLTGGTNQQELSMRLDATSAMRTLIGNASGTYAMSFTANLTGPTRIGENAELYVTYDYDPFAVNQVNTAYQWVYSSSTQLGTSSITSAAFNFNLPESNVTTTFAVGASSTNQLWVEYRGFIPGGTNVSSTVAWNAEATSSALFTQTTEEFGFLLLAAPGTANVSPNSNNTFRMVSSAATSISAPNALAIATYTFNFNSSATLRKTIQVPLVISTATNTNTTINTTSTVNIPEASPSSTNAFLFGRTIFSNASNPGVNASMTTGSCSTPAATAITQGAASTRNAGYLSFLWNVTASSSVNSAGNWNICSTFTMSAVVNIPQLALYLSYNYANTMAAGVRTNSNISFLGVSNLSPTGTAFAAGTLDSRIANASATAKFSWLDAEFSDDGAGATGQVLTSGIAGTNNAFTFLARSTARRTGAAFSATSTSGYASGIAIGSQCSVACINDATYNVFGQTDVIAANITQSHFHWRNNDGSESAASALATEDTAVNVATSTILRLRFGVENAGDASSSAAFRIEYQKNATSGAWTQLATSTLGSAEWQMATSSQVSDGTATTNIATSTGGITNINPLFLAGEVVASTSRNQAANIVITGTQATDEEFAMRATANATVGAIYYFRLSNAGSAIATYSIYPSATVIVSSPTVSNVLLNGGSSITLIPNATSTVTLIASTTDPGGAANISFATSTIYRTGLGTSCAANNQNCYQLSSSSCAFTASTSTVTCTAGIWYFAQSTGNASATFPADSWTGAITVTNGNSGTKTATSSAVNVNVLTAITVTPSSINYGTLAASSTSGSSNQATIVQNAGNSSTTLQVSGTAFINGPLNFATSSQHYATSSFTFGGMEQQLNGSPTTVSGFTLTTATSTTGVQGSLFWGVTVPPGVSIGTYTATSTFTAVFSP